MDKKIIICEKCKSGFDSVRMTMLAGDEAKLEPGIKAGQWECSRCKHIFFANEKMIVTPGPLHEEFSRDNYWARIHFESNDKSKKTVVLICASSEYLWDLFRAKKVSEVKLDEWHKQIIKKWENRGENIFNKPVQYDVYANTDEGKINGLDFLKKDIKS